MWFFIAAPFAIIFLTGAILFFRLHKRGLVESALCEEDRKEDALEVECETSDL